mgnify:CR=1 FL=1
MFDMKKIKVGVIGLGQRGMGLLGAMMACEEADVVAVCDKYKDRREDGAKRVKETRQRRETIRGLSRADR